MDFQVRVLALQQSIGPDVVFVGVRVDDACDRCIFQCFDQFPGCMSTAGVNQQSVHKISGRPVAASSGEGACQVKADDGLAGAGFQHDELRFVFSP